MDYDSARQLAVTDAYKSVLARLVAAYRPGRPVLILLPGGMGSQLDRSAAPFTGDPIDFTQFKPVWLDLGVVFDQSGAKMAIEADGHDLEDHLIVPDGPVRFALLPAYDGIQAWCDAQSYNYIVFGFDWRRGVVEAAQYLEAFLQDLALEIQALHGEDPLPNTTLMCHSQGGLVAKLFLHLDGGVQDRLRSVITVATPFYGTADTAPGFYFKGHPILNLIYGAGQVARIMASCPGPYALMPPDYATWQKRSGLLGVADYPVRDEADGPIDPYDTANMSRYPPWVTRDYITDARNLRQTIDRDLDEPRRARLFHLRAASTGTVGRFRWNPLPPNFTVGRDPPSFHIDQTAPQGGVVDGDGTVPFYSAALAGNIANAFKLPTRQRHGDLAENVRVLEAVRVIVETGALPDAAALEVLPDTAYSTATRPVATPSAVRGLLAGIADGSVDRNVQPSADMARGLHKALML